MSLSRREFLNRSALTGLGLALTGGLDTLVAPGSLAATAGPRYRYGPLVADPAGLLALPRGFSYRVVAKTGVTHLETGERTPDRPDGTASFGRRDGGFMLVNNHELSPLYPVDNAVPHVNGTAYDPASPGGCTNIKVSKDGHRVREYVSLSGTSNNCAGGRTPWHTWLSCEETEDLAGTNGFTRDHGYVFEVDPHSLTANRDPRPLIALGRFKHEAAVVDPEAGRLYLTEDANTPNGLLYRYTPPSSAQPLRAGSLKALGVADGRLQAMRAHSADGAHVPDLSVITERGTTLQVRWVDVPDRDARTTSVRMQLGDEQVTRSHKFEGAWWGRGGAYIVASYARAEDSPAEHDGQIWFYDPMRRTLTLKLYLPVNTEPLAYGRFDGPDNITVSPYGGTIFAEDGEGLQHLVGVTDGGRTYPIARNQINIGTAAEPAYSEMTGPNFSWTGRYLFANVQEPGHVYAIRGPWDRNGGS